MIKLKTKIPVAIDSKTPSKKHIVHLELVGVKYKLDKFMGMVFEGDIIYSYEKVIPEIPATEDTPLIPARSMLIQFDKVKPKMPIVQINALATALNGVLSGTYSENHETMINQAVLYALENDPEPVFDLPFNQWELVV